MPKDDTMAALPLAMTAGFDATHPSSDSLF